MKHWQFGGIKGKLLVGLGSMLGFTALVAITGVWWIMKLERVNDEAVDAGLTVERQIKEWHRLTRANTLRTLLLLKTNDPVLEKEVRVEIDETVKKVNGILRKLEAALHDDPIVETFPRQPNGACNTRRSAPMHSRQKRPATSAKSAASSSRN